MRSEGWPLLPKRSQCWWGDAGAATRTAINHTRPWGSCDRPRVPCLAGHVPEPGCCAKECTGAGEALQGGSS